MAALGADYGCLAPYLSEQTAAVDGVPVDSCIYPVFKAAGCSVTTVEGLAQGDQLHPVQEAFIAGLERQLAEPGLGASPALRGHSENTARGADSAPPKLN